MRFDLLIKGGEVVDPEGGFSGFKDIAITNGRIIAVDSNIPADLSSDVVNASGMYVTPGLIDLHAHVYTGVTFWGVSADAIGSQSGVTTWADAGSSGALNLQGFRDYVIAPSKTRILAFVNIASIGLTAQDYELALTELCNIELLKAVAARHRDIIAGIKVRAGQSGKARNLVPFTRARKVADDLQLPLMMHISDGPPDLESALAFLKPGDILTHCCTGWSMKLIDSNGKMLPAAKKAVDGGVILDLGHGSGSLSFDNAEAMMSQGYPPQVISTDLHQLSIQGPNLTEPSPGTTGSYPDQAPDAPSAIFHVKGNGKPVFNLLTCMDKMLCLGMSFPQIITATTRWPARILGLAGQAGTLKPGVRADIAGLIIDKGDYELVDVHGKKRRTKQHVRHAFTILNGKRFERMEMPALPPWIVPTGNG